MHAETVRLICGVAQRGFVRTPFGRREPLNHRRDEVNVTSKSFPIHSISAHQTVTDTEIPFEVVLASLVAEGVSVSSTASSSIDLTERERVARGSLSEPAKQWAPID